MPQADAELMPQAHAKLMPNVTAEPLSAGPVLTVGVVGIGLMGLAMAQRLHECGHHVHVFDIDPARMTLAREAGLLLCDGPAATAAGCQALIVAVVDAAQTEAVLFGPRGAAAAQPATGAVLLCPTIAPGSTQALAGRLQAMGLEPIDAPMSGGPARARSGTMSLMVACADTVFARWQGLLNNLSSQVFRVGTEPGDGAKTKLVNNLLAAINLAGAAQALALAEHLGLDAATTLGVMEQSSAQSWIASDRLRRALAADESAHAQMSLLAKDSALAMQAAAACGYLPSLGSLAQQVFAQACAAGLASADDSALWRWVHPRR